MANKLKTNAIRYQFTKEEQNIIDSLNKSQKALFDKLTDIDVKRMYLQMGSVTKEEQKKVLEQQPYDLTIETPDGDTYHTGVQKVKGKSMYQVCQNYWKVLGIGYEIFCNGQLVIDVDGKPVGGRL